MRWLVLSLILPMAACLDVEADFALGEDEVITGETTITLGRQLYDMLLMVGPQGQTLCPDLSEKTVGAETVTCVTRDATTLGAAIAELEAARDDDPFLSDAEILRVDDETVRVVLPLDFENIEGRPAELTAENPMFGMITGGLAGSNIVVRLTALEVIESNGAISGDGRSVELVIPTVEVLQPSGMLPDAFTAVLKYRDCGLFGC